MEEGKDYLPIIKVVNAQIRYFIQFKDIHKQQNCIEVTEEVFLQFFGVHHHDKTENEEHYFIVFKAQDHFIKKEVTKEKFLEYQSFRSMKIREQNIYDRYIEHYEMDERKLYQKRKQESSSKITNALYKESLMKELYSAIATLPEVQKRRLVLHYLNGLSLAQIARKEHCSKSSIQCSIKIALAALNEKLKRFRD